LGRSRRKQSFRSWLERLEADIDTIARGPSPRLQELQPALVD
jgi:hypothetical protein